MSPDRRREPSKPRRLRSGPFVVGALACLTVGLLLAVASSRDSQAQPSHAPDRRTLSKAVTTDGSAHAGDVASNIVRQRCTKCHGARRKAAGLDLTKGLEPLVGAASSQSSFALVEAGQPERSYLFLKLTGRHDGSGKGARMPLGGKPLQADAIATIRKWIQDGAR